MTGTELMTNAVALMGGDLAAAADYSDYALPSINLMLADLFEINNAILLANALATLTAIPEIATIGDAIPCRDELVRGVMPYGLARDLGRTEGHPAIGAFTRLYDENKLKYSVGIPVAITDCYADDTDDDIIEVTE